MDGPGPQASFSCSHPWHPMPCSRAPGGAAALMGGLAATSGSTCVSFFFLPLPLCLHRPLIRPCDCSSGSAKEACGGGRKGVRALPVRVSLPGGPGLALALSTALPLLAVHYEHTALECNCTAPAQAESAENFVPTSPVVSAASSSVCVGRRKVSSITQRPVKENCLQEKLCTSTGPATMRRPHRRTRSVSSSLVQYLLLLAGPACKKKKRAGPLVVAGASLWCSYVKCRDRRPYIPEVGPRPLRV